jgi:hypothetical protein
MGKGEVICLEEQRKIIKIPSRLAGSLPGDERDIFRRKV